MKIRQFLELPFTYFNNKNEKWLYILSSSIFVILFLVIYRPFGIISSSDFKPITVLFVLTEGIKVLLILSLTQFWYRKKVFNDQSQWTFKYSLIFFLCEIFLIQLLSFFIFLLVEIIFGISPLDMDRPLYKIIISFLEIYFSRILLMIYPFAGSILYIYIRRLKDKTMELEQELEDMQHNYIQNHNDNDLIEIKDENDNIILLLPLNQIISFESQNQYVLINYVKDEILEKTLIRTQLKKIIAEFSELPIVQCHRSYAINLLQVNFLKIIDRKHFLIIKKFESFKVPVSKTYLSKIKESIQKELA